MIGQDEERLVSQDLLVAVLRAGPADQYDGRKGAAGSRERQRARQPNSGLPAGVDDLFFKIGIRLLRILGTLLSGRGCRAEKQPGYLPLLVENELDIQRGDFELAREDDYVERSRLLLARRQPRFESSGLRRETLPDLRKLILRYGCFHLVVEAPVKRGVVSAQELRKRFPGELRNLGVPGLSRAGDTQQDRNEQDRNCISHLVVLRMHRFEDPRVAPAIVRTAKSRLVDCNN
ncbi:MAG: hypothetical protein BWY42_01667 [Candidatus Omnitrophica bacterium ADurb.Bin277]|nr:MAG: hypothetical protein BWY42_01667 [Candidatus Omnitrophica bacterium ADurb.Bin277]